MEQWESFLSEAFSELKRKQTILGTEYGFGNHERWDLDQKNRAILFSNDGSLSLRANFDAVGSISTTAGTWLWSWANPSLTADTYENMLVVREFGETRKIRPLILPEWPGDETDGWEMTAVAVKLLDSQGAYRIPIQSGAFFVSLYNVTRIS
ncbi:DUF6882 domain-containing protein [Hwanghaeella sp.]|uniref:DUF6882 domain-containing protein n=1 Tax=Hwanghaeella sp. TaxID=2605943 RepID=UPI003CCC151B